MRLASSLLAGVFALMTLGVMGGRWLGQVASPAPFPVPDAAGCWQDLCFARMSPDAVAAELNAQAGIVPGSARFVDDVLPTGSRLPVEFVYAPDGRNPRRVLLYWAEHSYDLTRDWRHPGNPSLLALGEIVQALGAPAQVSLLTDYLLLHYPAQRLRVVVLPAAQGSGWVRVTPADRVTSLFVTDLDVSSAPATVYCPPSVPWQGFGIFRFES